MGMVKTFHNDYLNQMARPILPEECEEPDMKDCPPENVREMLGSDGKRWHMWGRVCDRLAEDGQVKAPDLVYDGWIGERQAIRFLRSLQIIGAIRPDGVTYRGTRQGMIEYTVYRLAK